MPLHVLQLGPYPPPEGGISRNMLATRERLLDKGDRCSIVVTSRSSRISDDPHVHHPATPWELIKQVRELKADVVHLHVGGEVNSRVLSLMSAVSLVSIGRSVLTLHSGGYPDTPEAKAARHVSTRGFIFRSFKRLIAVNPRIEDVFELYGVPEHKTRVISPFSCRLPDQSVNVPEELRVFRANHAPLLVAVGGLERDYDPLFLINSMPAVKKRYPASGLVIVGGGSLRPDAEKAVAASECGNSIFLATDLSHQVTLRLMEWADVMLRTTLFDGDAISVREALFLGTPVIASDNGMRPAGVRLMTERTADELINAIDDCLLEGHGPGAGEEDFRNIDEVLGVYKEIARSRK